MPFTRSAGNPHFSNSSQFRRLSWEIKSPRQTGKQRGPGVFSVVSPSCKLLFQNIQIDSSNAKSYGVWVGGKINDFHRPGKMSQETELRG